MKMRMKMELQKIEVILLLHHDAVEETHTGLCNCFRNLVGVFVVVVVVVGDIEVKNYDYADYTDNAVEVVIVAVAYDVDCNLIVVVKYNDYFYLMLSRTTKMMKKAKKMMVARKTMIALEWKNRQWSYRMKEGLEWEEEGIEKMKMTTKPKMVFFCYCC